MARRSENPLMVLVLGLFTVALFGGALVWLSDNRPILRLRPVLEQSYGLAGIETRFVPSTREQAAHIVVTLPSASLVPDEAAALAFARRALEEYVALAEQRTQVRSCVVRVRTDPPEQVRARLLMSAVRAFASLEQTVRGLEGRLTKLGLSDARVVVSGTTPSGASLRVAARVPAPADAERCADKAAAALTRHQAVGRYELTVRHSTGVVRRTGGRDAPPTPKRAPAQEAPRR